MLKRIYDRLLAVAAHRHASWWLALVAFIESSVFPIPPDVLLIPMVLADRRRAWFYAGLATLASVVGGFLGYAIGSVFFDTVGQWIVHTYHLEAEAEHYAALFRENAIRIMMVKGLVPVIPYKLITITAGLAHMDLLTFGLTSVAVRALRFFLVAGLLWKFGEPVRDFIEKRLALVTTACAVGLVGGFLIIKYI
ncbi:MAG TPA: YqaA family protein [Candidatus Sulfotelmatobacter sp.]|jgi:membrane protein YqaA with SNARE-associated domain|nr:YqaA family protein [Candidatus Sulfotelmatobacter sp.]